MINVHTVHLCSMVSSLTELFSFGRAGVECYCQHDSGAAVIQLQFLVNEVSLVKLIEGTSLHFCSPYIQLYGPPPQQHSLVLCRKSLLDSLCPLFVLASFSKRIREDRQRGGFFSVLRRNRGESHTLWSRGNTIEKVPDCIIALSFQP